MDKTVHYTIGVVLGMLITSPIMFTLGFLLGSSSGA